MFSRSLARAATAATAATTRTAVPVRLLSSTSVAASKITPALADIHPDNHDSFNSKQKAFREKLIADQIEAEASTLRPTPCRSPVPPPLALGDEQYPEW